MTYFRDSIPLIKEEICYSKREYDGIFIRQYGRINSAKSRLRKKGASDAEHDE